MSHTEVKCLFLPWVITKKNQISPTGGKVALSFLVIQIAILIVNIFVHRAFKLHCINARHPDHFGHYREANFTQAKHHWWWKANQVFSHLEITKDHNGLVLFLEEDIYMVEDFLHVLKLMEKFKSTWCNYCRILSLGDMTRRHNFARYSKEIQISPWMGTKHNIGLAFNHSTWSEIVRCSRYFCRFDDYNWDFSLQYASANCIKSKLYALVARSKRIFHIGECGMHHAKNNCSVADTIKKVQKVLWSSRKYIYPFNLALTHISKITDINRTGYGGWEDHRDHKLCLNMTRTTRKKKFFQRLVNFW